MHKLKRIKQKLLLFWQLNLQQKLFFFLNFFLCGAARASIRIFPLRYLSPYFGSFNKKVIVSQLITAEQMAKAREIGRSVRLAAKYTPWDSSCLTQAMVAKFWCQYYKIPYAFYIGFAKADDKPIGFSAHAWVMAGPVALTGGYGFSSFQVVSSYFSRYALPGLAQG